MRQRPTGVQNTLQFSAPLYLFKHFNISHARPHGVYFLKMLFSFFLRNQDGIYKMNYSWWWWMNVNADINVYLLFIQM